MQTLPWRILIAVVFVVFVSYVLPPLFRLFGFPLTGDVELIVRACVAVIAVYYVLTGRPALT